MYKRQEYARVLYSQRFVLKAKFTRGNREKKRKRLCIRYLIKLSNSNDRSKGKLKTTTKIIIIIKKKKKRGGGGGGGGRR